MRVPGLSVKRKTCRQKLPFHAPQSTSRESSGMQVKGEKNDDTTNINKNWITRYSRSDEVRRIEAIELETIPSIRLSTSCKERGEARNSKFKGFAFPSRPAGWYQDFSRLKFRLYTQDQIVGLCCVYYLVWGADSYANLSFLFPEYSWRNPPSGVLLHL